MESVETKTSSPASTDAQLMLSDSTPTAGAHTDPPGASPAAVEENIPTEKPKKRKKKKGIRAFFRRIGKAIKPYIICCNGNNKVTPFPYSDPTDGQPDLSGLEWALSVDTCPSGIKLPVNGDPPHPELSSLGDISSLELTSESDLELPSISGPAIMELMSVSDVSSLELTSESDPEPSSVSCPAIMKLMCVSDMSSLELSSESDPELSSVSGSSIMELMSVLDVSSLKLAPEGDPANLEQLSVTGPTILDSELTLDPELMFVSGSSSLEKTSLNRNELTLDPELMFVSGSSSLEITSLNSNKLTPDSSQVDPESSPAPGPSELDSRKTEALGLFSSFYEVKEELGSGSFGNVYEGIRRFDGQKVAIKRLKKRNFDSHIILPGSTKPLLTELAVNLLMRQPPKSPHVVQMLDWFDMPEHPIIIMEFPYPCETLFSFTMRNGGVLDETVARGLMRQAVLGAKHCIDRGVFHNDINTDNILVNTETLQLKIIDFGCSELFKTAYGRELAVKSTVWSLGIVLLDIVSRDQDNSVFQSRKHGPQVLGLSNECCDLIKRCLQHYRTEKPTLESMLEHKWFESN